MQRVFHDHMVLCSEVKSYFHGWIIGHRWNHGEVFHNHVVLWPKANFVFMVQSLETLYAGGVTEKLFTIIWSSGLR